VLPDDNRVAFLQIAGHYLGESPVCDSGSHKTRLQSLDAGHNPDHLSAAPLSLLTAASERRCAVRGAGLTALSLSAGLSLRLRRSAGLRLLSRRVSSGTLGVATAVAMAPALLLLTVRLTVL